MVLDWFAPHLDDRVDEMLERSDVACLRIGGGLTSDVQVCDTHRHGPLTSCYRSIESRDMQRQMRLRPHKLPCFSPQHVYDVSLQAWTETSTRVDGRKEWVQNACLNALDGSEDGQIASGLVEPWTTLGMTDIRDQLRAEVEAEVQAGRLHSFWQYKELLEPYDEHPGVIEGMEDALRMLGGDDDDEGGDDAEGDGAADGDEDDDDDGGGGGAPERAEELRDLEELPEPCGTYTVEETRARALARESEVTAMDGGPEPLPEDDSLVADSKERFTMMTSCPEPGKPVATAAVVALESEAPASVVVSRESEARASDVAIMGSEARSWDVVTQESDARAVEAAQRERRSKHLAALSQAAALLREAGDLTTAQSLEQRGHAIAKVHGGVTASTRQFMAVRSAQRLEQERREQEAAAREDAHAKELDARYRIAKEESVTKKAEVALACEATRVKLLEAEAQRKGHREMVELRKSNLLYLQQHLAADLVKKAQHFLQHVEHGAERERRP